MAEKIKGKRPAFQFYPGDWWRDAGLRSCSIAARGLWVDLMCLMHDGEPYGHLAINNRPLTDVQAASMVGLSLPQYRKLLREIEQAGVSSRTDKGVLFSRRMVRDEHNRKVRAEGGRKSLDNPNVPRPKGHKEGPPEGPTEGYPSDHPSGDPGGGSFDPSPAVAVAVASAGTTSPPPPPRADSDPLSRCRRGVPASYRPALEGALRSARHPEAIAAELCALADGMRGTPPPTWEHLGLALHDLAVAGSQITANTLRAFARKARDGAGTMRDASAAGTHNRATDGVDWGELERAERERQRQEATG